MSDLWEICEGSKKIGPLAMNAWRVVEDQSRCSTRKLVDTLEEYEILEHEIENNKPNLPPDCKSLHYLFFTAFRYPPLQHGSRFGKKTEPSLWYGSKLLSTALAETAFYRLVFILGSAMKSKIDQIIKTAYLAKVNTALGLDLTKDKFLSHREPISSPIDWKMSQSLGAKMRENKVEAFTYFSARDQDKTAENVGLFTGKAFAHTQPLSLKNFIQFSNDTWVEFIAKESQEKYIFSKEDFMINQDFPFPPA